MTDMTRIQIDIKTAQLRPWVLEMILGAVKHEAESNGVEIAIARPKMATDEQLEAARDEYQTGDVQIDDDAQVSYVEDPDSIGADYCWVQAWVRVDDAPMPVTANRVMHYLRSEIEYPATLTLEEATAHALAEVHANHSPDALLSPSDLRDELDHLWDGE